MIKQISAIVVFLLFSISSLFCQSCLELSGGEDYVEITNNKKSDGLNSFFIEAWVKPTQKAIDNKAFIFCKFNKKLEEIYKLGLMANGAIEIRINGSKFILHSKNNLVESNVWNHLGVSYDNQQVKLFVNGVLVEKRSFNSPLMSSNNGKILIGIDDDSHVKNMAFNQAFDGLLDEVRLWSKPFNQKEIRAQMFQSIDKEEENLVLCLNFNQESKLKTNPPLVEGNVQLKGNAKIVELKGQHVKP